MLHSGSRGVGNRIGRYFIERAKKDDAALVHQSAGPGSGLSRRKATPSFDDYVEAVELGAGLCAEPTAKLMMERRAAACCAADTAARSRPTVRAVNCHHNYVARENHFGENVWVTRKGAVRAREGDLGIIPGSMGARSYIVRGKGNPDSFHTCCHGAGRAMSRDEAKRRFTVEDHEKATAGIECRKDAAVIDETPMAYKDIDAVMAAQADLVEIVHTLRQVVCVKG